jgi:hypothetical protein
MGRKEQVHDVLSVHQNMPSHPSCRTITKQFDYDERVEAEEKRKSFFKK